jgi:glycine oxidase
MAPARGIVVVGAGIIGCAIAYEMSRRGAAVEILDDRPTGMGSTQAGAGMLAPFIEAREGGALLDLTARGLGVFDDFVGRVARETGLPINYHRTGTLDVALSDAALQRLSQARASVAERGIAAEWLDRAAVRLLEPGLSERALGGLLIPTHGFVGALDLARALAAGAQRHGAQIVACGRVRRVERFGDGLSAIADRGTRHGECVVIAAGSWSGQIEVEGVRASLPVKPIRGQLLHLGWEGPPLRRVLFGERCYLVPWHDRTVLLGATVEDVGFDERATVAGVRELLNALCELVPDASASSVAAVKTGLRPGTPDHLPIIGRSVVLPNLVYATGHYRNGILLAPLTAQLVADAVLDGRIDPILGHTAPDRFGAL